MSGFQDWTRTFPVRDGRVYLQGRSFRNWLEVEGGELTIGSTDTLHLLRTHAGTSIVQGFYRGEQAPRLADWKTFQTGFLADDEGDFFTFERLRSTGLPLQFFIGDWACDTFEAVGGHTYKLLRAPANGLVPGVTDEDFPVKVELDGEEAPDAAIIAGQTVVASASGELSITYAPLYQVLILGVQRVLSDFNQLVVSTTITEVVA